MTYLYAIQDLPRVAIGNALDVLATLPERSVHCCVTSPPYYGLRKYPTAPVIWDGDPKCKHTWGAALVHPGAGAGNNSAIRGPAGSAGLNIGQKLLVTSQEKIPAGQFCTKCHAWMGHLGNEPTPELYIRHLVQIFRALRRVLRDDGVVFLNLGDSYAGGSVNDREQNWRPGVGRADGVIDSQARRNRNGISTPQGLKTLDLVGIPWSVALALRADGWYLRSDVIWHKLSCMPEPQQGWRWERCRVKVRSVSSRTQAKALQRDNPGGGLDQGPGTIWQPCPGCPKCASHDGYVLRRGAWRPTESHEYIFMLAKTSDYYCDNEAVKVTSKREASGNVERKGGEAVGLPAGGLGRSIPWTSDGSGSNLRTVWTLGPEPLKDAHFAAFPSAIPRTCIKASTSERGCCPTCGAPWARVVGRDKQPQAYADRKYDRRDPLFATKRNMGGRYQAQLDENPKKTLDWRPTCECPTHDPVPCTVLDIFAGSGTTLRTAEELGRLWLGIDLSDQYQTLIKKRTGQRTILGMVGRAAVAKVRKGRR